MSPSDIHNKTLATNKMEVENESSCQLALSTSYQPRGSLHFINAAGAISRTGNVEI